MSGRIAPGLLLAMPQLGDPVFAHAVILVVEHDERGSFGLIVNKRTDVRLSDVVEEAGLVWPEPCDQVIWDGGPVIPGPDEPDGFILHHPDPAKIEPHDVNGHGAAADDDEETVGDFLVYPFPPNLETLDVLAGEPPNRLRFFMGYAAWAPGQLESELLHDSWILAPADPVLIFDTPPEHMWESAFHSLGVEPGAIIQSRGLH